MERTIATRPARMLPLPGSARHALVKRAAIACLGTGLLLLSFVAYQLWGTALYEHHAQGVLRQELKARGIVPDETPHPPSSATGTSQPASSGPTVVPAIAQPAVGQPIGFMTIPQIGMSSDAIVQGTGEDQLEEGPGHYTGTPLPGEAGNVAIAGHRTTYAHPFYELNELVEGDLVYIQTLQGTFTYQVSKSEIVSPSDVDVLDSSAIPELTLTTCNPRYSSTQRLVVVAFLVSSKLATASPAAASPASPSPRAPSRPASLAGDATAEPTVMGEVGEAMLWGTLALALALLARYLWRRLAGIGMVLLVALGTPAVLAALLMCFQHVSLALPETF